MTATAKTIINLNFQPSGGKTYCAEITGRSEKYGFERKFLGCFSQSRSGSGKTGINSYELIAGKVYETSAGWKDRAFVTFDAEDGEIVKVSDRYVSAYLDRLEAEKAAAAAVETIAVETVAVAPAPIEPAAAVDTDIDGAVAIETIAVEIVTSPVMLLLPTKKQAAATQKACRAYSKAIKASARRATKAQKESAKQAKRTARAIGIANTASRRAVVKLLKAWLHAAKETAQIETAAAKAERAESKKAASATKPAKSKKIAAAEPINVAVETETPDFWEVVLR